MQALKEALKGKVQETLSAVADDGIEQSGLHIWSFGTTAESYEQKRGNYKVKAAGAGGRARQRGHQAV